MRSDLSSESSQNLRTKCGGSSVPIEPIKTSRQSLRIRLDPNGQKKESQDRPSCVEVKNFSVNSLLTKSGCARPSFRAILHLSSLSALRLALLATVLGEGGVLLLFFVELERVDVKDPVVEEGVGARSGRRGGREVEFGVVARCGFEIGDRRFVFTLLVEGDRSLIVFLGSGVLGSGFSRPFFGVIGVNQSAYSWLKILEGRVGEAVRGCR